MRPRLIRKTFIFASTEYHDYGEFKQNRAQKALRFSREKIGTANSVEVTVHRGNRGVGWTLMGNQKQKWTAAEEEALLAGVRKHGTGKWRIILKDPDFAPSLIHRTNIDLKDKWRNLNVSSSYHKDRSRKPKLKSLPAAQLSNTPNSAAPALLTCNELSAHITSNLPNSASDTKNSPRYSVLVFEALSTMNDINGSDIGAIARYIEARHDVALSFRKSLSTRLKKLVLEGKLEKVHNRYKIPKETSVGMKPSTPKLNDVKRLRPSQNAASFRETLEEASMAAAYRIAEAENKSFLAAEAVREAERVSKMAEDTDVMLQLVEEIYEQCLQGQIVLLA